VKATRRTRIAASDSRRIFRRRRSSWRRRLGDVVNRDYLWWLSGMRRLRGGRCARGGSRRRQASAKKKKGGKRDRATAKNHVSVAASQIPRWASPGRFGDWCREAICQISFRFANAEGGRRFLLLPLSHPRCFAIAEVKPPRPSIQACDAHPAQSGSRKGRRTRKMVRSLRRQHRFTDCGFASMCESRCR